VGMAIAGPALHLFNFCVVDRVTGSHSASGPIRLSFSAFSRWVVFSFGSEQNLFKGSDYFLQ
jgi:hypothetical protein